MLIRVARARGSRNRIAWMDRAGDHHHHPRTNERHTPRFLFLICS